VEGWDTEEDEDFLFLEPFGFEGETMIFSSASQSGHLLWSQ
jgi:hypothetical protein